jgi:glutaredoxin
MLMKELGEKCNFKPVTLIYFYSNENCPDCTKQGFVLTALREKYPLLRVYAFDADLDLSAIKTLQTITDAPATVPSMVIGGKVYTGYKSIEEIEKAVPALARMLTDQKAADKKVASTKNTQ